MYIISIQIIIFDHGGSSKMFPNYQYFIGPGKENDGTDRADHDDDESATCPEDYGS